MAFYKFSVTEFDRLYIDQGILDYLREEKAQGRIRSLGFSFHGDVPFFYHLMDQYLQALWRSSWLGP